MFPFVFNFLLFKDLRPIFHWNTKQLFLYLSAEYNNTQGVCSHLPRFNPRSPGKRLSHSTEPSLMAPEHQETHPAFHF